MAPESKNPTEVHNQQYLMEVEGDGSALQPFLAVRPPEDASRTPPILAFKRKREIDIPWDDIVSGAKDTGACAGGVGAIREYFEESWGIDNFGEAWMNDEDHKLIDDTPDGWRVRELTEEKPVFRPNLDETEKPEPITKGFVIRHGTSGRVYYLIDPGNALGEHSFNSWEGYIPAWRDRIEGVELVFEKDVDAKSYYMDFEEIDLRPVVIRRKYQELDILLKFANNVKENVKGVTNDMIKRITETTLDADELEQLQRKVLRLEISAYDVEQRIQRLASDAARLGYLLITQEGLPPKTNPDGVQTPLEKGKVYTTYKRTARWIEYVPTNVRFTVGRWIFKRTKWKQVNVPRPREQVVEDYKEVDTSKDLLEEKRSAMRKGGYEGEGREGYHVCVFDQTPDGLVSTEGEPLYQIMDRCRYDEQFRRTCAVMLPVYEESLTGLRMVAKYSIYKRPLPGIAPTILPRLSLEESLTYRTAWLGTQLGELVSTINLAPDEQRQVTITKRFEQETTVARTSTSIFDVSRAETSDLSTEMENQARQERESSKSMQFSTKASGGYGPFSAEASASGGASSSLKDVSQAISKVARKAAKSVSSQNRQEVSSATTSRTTVSNTDETVAMIRNINQGRSLNLMFHRLYNKYKGGLYLEDLRFDVIPSVELISGSGVHESRSYSLEELPDLIDEFKDARLPFAIDDAEKYTDHLLDSIETLLSKEYSTGERRDEDVCDGTDAELLSVTVARGKFRKAPETGTSVARLRFQPAGPLRPEGLLGAGQQANGAGVEDRLAKLSDGLRQAAIESDDPIAPQELLVAAPGLYLDAVVGAQPSTEPYSELMRDQEVKMRQAEVFAKRAEATYQEAMAMRLARMRAGEDANCLTGALPAPNQKSLTLSLRIPLTSGDWYLQVDHEDDQKVETTDVGRHIIAFSWREKQDWLKGDDLLSRIALVNKTSGDAILYPA